MNDILEDIIDALFLYSEDTLIRTYLKKSPDYKVQCQITDETYTALQKLLTPGGQKLLDEFINARDFVNYTEMEANFRAGLTIGMYLSRI